MKIHTLHKWLLVGALISGAVFAATVSRIKTFSDGDILTASDLNIEFDNVVDGINSISNDNIATNAAISPAKISANIKGSAIGRNSTTGALSVNVDDSTIGIVSDQLVLKDDSVDTDKLVDDSVTTAKIANDSITTDKILDSNVTTSKLNDLSVTNGKIANTTIAKSKLAALGQQISSSSGNFNVTNSSTTFADVTNLSVTITTSGRPVFVSLISDGSDEDGSSGNIISTSSAAKFRFRRGSTTIAVFSIGVSGEVGKVPSSSFMHIDTPSAGTYTYSFQHASATGTSVGRNVGYTKLIAYEL